MILLILMWSLCILVVFCWDILGSLIQTYFGQYNKCALMHKEKKIVLLSMTRAEIVKYHQDKRMCTSKIRAF